jgi:hypothetical protein
LLAPRVLLRCIAGTAGGRKEGRTLRAEELAGDVEGFTPHNDDLLAIEKLFGDSASQATEKMSLAINDDLGVDSVSWEKIF